jgi:dTDP-4-dehydrorhamnose reductase
MQAREYVHAMAKRMVVTGGHGFLGRRVVGLATDAGWEVTAPTSRELDIRDADEVDRLLRTSAADTVVHLAYRRDERETIVAGSANVARTSAAVGARLVHLSTDVVFAGRPSPYCESDLPTPVEAYGAAKADAEGEVAAAAPAAVLVRTSLLLGEPGDLGQPQLDVVAAASGERPFTFFTDEIRCPTYAIDIAAAVMALCGPQRSISGPIHVAGPEAMDRATLARRLAERLGLDDRSLTTGRAADLGLAGRRPGCVVLDTGRADSLGLRCRPV